MVLKSRMEQPSWWDVGAYCTRFPLPTHHDIENDAWFHDMDEAQKICNGVSHGSPCPVRETCTYFALVNNEGEGVWGGYLPVQRRWIRKQKEMKPFWETNNIFRDLVPHQSTFVEDDGVDNETDGVVDD